MDFSCLDCMPKTVCLTNFSIITSICLSKSRWKIMPSLVSLQLIWICHLYSISMCPSSCNHRHISLHPFNLIQLFMGRMRLVIVDWKIFSYIKEELNHAYAKWVNYWSNSFSKSYYTYSFSRSVKPFSLHAIGNFITVYTPHPVLFNDEERSGRIQYNQQISTERYDYRLNASYWLMCVCRWKQSSFPKENHRSCTQFEWSCNC